MRREVPNEVSARLEEEVAIVSADVAALERRRAMLAQAAGSAGKDMARLNELYAGEARLERLSVELQLARQAYEGVSAKYQSARLSALARTPQLRVVDPAIVPDLPRGQYTVRNVLLGFIAGTLLACGVVILHDALRAS